MEKYYNLRLFFENLNETTIILSYSELTKILGFSLPNSASLYREWWANSSKGHTHARSWLNPGWKVENVHLGQDVTFMKSV